MKDLTITFEVPGQPQGKERHRTTKDGHTYTPEKTVKYQGLIAAKYWKVLAAKMQTLNKAAKIADIEIEILAQYAVPKSDSKATKVKKLAGEILPRVKPDLDNVAKAVLDALNNFAYYDDSQVVKLIVTKKYSDNPGLLVKVIHKNCMEDQV